MYWKHFTTSIRKKHPHLLVVVHDEAPLVDKPSQLRIRSLALFFVRLAQQFLVVRRPAAVADALVRQRIARAGPAEDAPTSSTMVPPPRDGEDALAAEAGLRGGVGDPELVFVGVGAHRFGLRVTARRLFCTATLELALRGPGARTGGAVVLYAI